MVLPDDLLACYGACHQHSLCRRGPGLLRRLSRSVLQMTLGVIFLCIIFVLLLGVWINRLIDVISDRDSDVDA